MSTGWLLYRPGCVCFSSWRYLFRYYKFYLVMTNLYLVMTTFYLIRAKFYLAKGTFVTSCPRWIKFRLVEEKFHLNNTVSRPRYFDNGWPYTRCPLHKRDFGQISIKLYLFRILSNDIHLITSILQIRRQLCWMCKISLTLNKFPLNYTICIEFQIPLYNLK